MYYEVIPLKMFRQDAGVLTYGSEMKLRTGQIVLIPLGKLHTLGVVCREVERPKIKIRQVEQLVYQTPVPEHLLAAIRWLSDYYLAPLPTVAQMVLPKGLMKNRQRRAAELEMPPKLPVIALNNAQKQALAALQRCKTSTKLLHGVTGSGKTNIYLKMALEALEAQKSTIVLVPEIALTSQLVQVFRETFGRQITLMHSRQTEAKRHQIWENLLLAKTPQIIIGARSALFAPVKDLGLIIIDEAHESAYYQENNPRYSALRLASFMAQQLNISCIQGTATPLASDYCLAEQHQAVIKLAQKAKKTAVRPDIKIIDLKSKTEFSKNRYFSRSLIAAMRENLKNHHQTLIFHNRRGSAPLTICDGCGWQALCPNCYLPLTLHTDSYQLICHTCGHCGKVPHACPECKNLQVMHKGFGTKLLEMELANLFPMARVARFDADNSRAESLAAKFDEVKDGQVDIIIGTQTVAKGLDLPKLATVGVVQADVGLALPDYAAEERAFHLLTQVLGRVGRGHLARANAFIQTYQPDHPAIRYAVDNDYDHFYNYILSKRRKGELPPFRYLARVTVCYKTEKTTVARIREAEQTLRTLARGVEVSAPAPAFHEHTTRGYCWQVVLKSESRARLVGALKYLPKNSNTHVVIDPPSLIS